MKNGWRGLFFFLSFFRGERGGAGSRASAQSGRRLVLMSSLFIKSTQGGCASA